MCDTIYLNTLLTVLIEFYIIRRFSSLALKCYVLCGISSWNQRDEQCVGQSFKWKHVFPPMEINDEVFNNSYIYKNTPLHTLRISAM